MNHPPTHAMLSLSAAAIICAHVAAGAFLGSVHLQILRSSVNVLAHGRGAISIVSLMVGRLALLACIMGLAALEGAAPLLAFAFGLLVSRWLLMRRFSVTTP